MKFYKLSVDEVAKLIYAPQWVRISFELEKGIFEFILPFVILRLIQGCIYTNKFKTIKANK